MDPELENINPRPKDSRYQIKKRQVIHENRWYRYVHDQGEMDNGKSYDYFFISKNFSVGIIALTEKQQIILVRQYRYLTLRDSLEVPGGGSDKDKEETPQELAESELLEETGYKAAHLRAIGEFDVANGHSSDISRVFLAAGCKKVSEQKLDDSEVGMVVELHPVEKVYEMVQDGKITDGFTLAALMLAWPHLL